MSILHHAAEFDRVLKLFANAGIDSAICGGAPRDALLDRPRKDIDVFVLEEQHGRVKQMRELLAGFTDLAPTPEPNLEGYDGFEIAGAYDFPNGVNVIVMSGDFTNWDECVNRCDFGICQVGYTTQRRFFWTDAFVKDALDQTFTLTCDGRRERSLERFKRLSAKYWDWKLVDPWAQPKETAAEDC